MVYRPLDKKMPDNSKSVRKQSKDLNLVNVQLCLIEHSKDAMPLHWIV